MVLSQFTWTFSNLPISSDSDSETRNNAKIAFQIYKEKYSKNADRIFNRLPGQVMSSLAKFDKTMLDRTGDRRRDPYDLTKTQTEVFNHSKLSKTSGEKKNYGRRVS